MRADLFLAALADPAGRRIDASAVALVVAHPDDETLILGGQLHRLAGLRVVMVTDGAPRDGDDARRLGFAGPAAYAAARRDELAVALGCGGVPPRDVLRLDLPDKGATRTMGALATVLQTHLSGVRTVVTHAYEGGHPDHDAVAFAVHEAATAMSRDSRPAVVEAPLYRAAPDGGMALFSFAAGDPGILLPVTDEGLARKRQMIAAHATQRAVLARFPPSVERLRAAPRHDFAALPNGGDLWYARLGWGLDGAGWLAAVAAARQARRAAIP